MHKGANGVIDANGKIDFSEIFVQSGAFTAGLTITYDDSSITRAKGSSQQVATNLKVGMRFQSTQVIRFCDAKAIQLVTAMPSDGRWRIVVFAGDIRQDGASRRLSQVRYPRNPWCSCTNVLARRILVLRSRSYQEVLAYRLRYRQLHRSDSGSLRRSIEDEAGADTRLFLARDWQMADER